MTSLLSHVFFSPLLPQLMGHRRRACARHVVCSKCSQGSRPIESARTRPLHCHRRRVGRCASCDSNKATNPPCSVIQLPQLRLQLAVVLQEAGAAFVSSGRTPGGCRLLKAHPIKKSHPSWLQLPVTLPPCIHSSEIRWLGCRNQFMFAKAVIGPVSRRV